MNEINSIRLGVNHARYDSPNARKKIAPIPVMDSVSSTENEHKKKSKSESIKYIFDINQFNNDSESLSRNSQFYRSDLLNEIYNKMSGNEPRFKPGSFVEYFA